VRAKIGMIGHQPMLYRDLSARENLLFFGRLYGVTDPVARAADLLERVQLTDRADDPAKAFSRGMAQRLAIARALMHDPQLLLADEPFSGLDLRSTRMLEQLLQKLNDDGRTIILTNHDVAQSLSMSKRVMMLRRGRVVIDCAATDIGVADAMREVTAA